MRIRSNRRKAYRRTRRGVAPGPLGSAIAIMAVSGLLGTGAVAVAQEPSAPPAADRSADQESPPLPPFIRDLELSQDQADAVRAVLDDLRDHGREPGATWRAAAALRGILDAEQIASLNEITARPGMPPEGRRGRTGRDRAPGAGGPGSRGAAPGDGYRGTRGGAGFGNLDDLDLSDEQKAELREIRESFAPRVRDVRTELRDGSVSRDEAGARLEAVRDSIHEAVQGVLTAEQRTLLETRRSEAEARREAAAARRDSLRAAAEARMEAERDAMIEVLGLSDSQEQTWIIHRALVGMAMRDRWPGGPGLRGSARRRTSRSGRQ